MRISQDMKKKIVLRKATLFNTQAMRRLVCENFLFHSDSCEYTLAKQSKEKVPPKSPNPIRTTLNLSQDREGMKKKITLPNFLLI